ncbi:MAG: iron-sulfur cluster co-chaperone HscB C-terminal domain-containing protein [Phycisphaerales bacterium]
MGDPFEALGLPARFDLSAEEVTRAWRLRAAGLHPDRQGGAGADGEIMRRAAELNEAKRALEDPERRAEALLRRLGGPSASEEKGLPEGTLVEFMEAREGLEEARASGDGEGVERWRAWAEERKRAHVRSVGELIGKGELREARVEMNGWRYTERMLEQIDEVREG